MSAIWRKPKQYLIEYESDRMICRSYVHTAGVASTLKSAKYVISNTRKEMAQYNPRNFKVYDTFADVEESTNQVPCIYQVD